MKSIIKELIISFGVTVILVFILSIIISATDLNENFVDSILIGIVSLSLLISGARLARVKKEKGIIHGGILGVFYMLILYLISSICNMNFSLTINSIIMIVLGILGGSLGGILGVNFLK